MILQYDMWVGRNFGGEINCFAIEFSIYNKKSIEFSIYNKKILNFLYIYLFISNIVITFAVQNLKICFSLIIIYINKHYKTYEYNYRK